MINDHIDGILSFSHATDMAYHIQQLDQFFPDVAEIFGCCPSNHPTYFPDLRLDCRIVKMPELRSLLTNVTTSPQ